MTRGIRNNNPLNIRHGKSQWVGMAKEQTDRAFVQFTERKYGYRAAFVLLKNYINKYGANTVTKIVERWAPAKDGNDTAGYIGFVCHTTGIGKHQPLCFEDKAMMVEIVRSMAQMESAVIEDKGALEEAYEEVRN